MAKLKAPKLMKPSHRSSQMERSGELKKDSQSAFSPLQKGKFLKGKKKLF